MKIGIFTEVYDPFISGVATSVKMLKTALEEMHHEVYIVTPNLNNNKFFYDKKNKILYLPGINTGICNTKLTSIYSKKAFKIIKSWHLYIIHSQTEFSLGLFSHVVSKKLNIPTVHTYHTLYEDYVHYILKGHFHKFMQKMAIKYTKYYCSKCDELIVPTIKIKDLFNNKYHILKYINVIPTGIDTTKFNLNSKIIKEVNKLKKKYHITKDDFIIGTVNRIAEEKNLKQELIAFKDLIKINSHIKLIIVGDCPYLSQLKEIITNLNLTNNVILTGKVKYENIPIYYHLFDVFTSFSTTETQGLTIIEALASSLPVVCINDDSFKEMITHNYNGYFFNNNQEFTKYILKLINETSKYLEMKTNANNSIYKYSKEVFASEILKVYQKAINKKIMN